VRPRHLLLALAGLIGAALAVCAVRQSQSVRREVPLFPAPGRLVDIGGRRLHLICIGEGGPTVVFEPSGFGGALSSSAARMEIGAKSRVCSYDRMGTGWSDAGPPVISVGLLADDLDQLLDRAEIRPPYVLVPSSIGGLTVELYARRHPERVAGLVFLDAANSDGLEAFAPRVTWAARQAACLTTLAARLGLVRAFDLFQLNKANTEDSARAISRLYRVEPFATLCGMVDGLAQTVAEFRNAPPLASDVPLAVLTAETTTGLVPPALTSLVRIRDDFTREHQNVAQAFARRSTRGTWKLVPGSGHLIASSQPHAVVEAVLELMKK